MPCRPTCSAPTTTRNSPPSSSPKESCGTCRRWCRRTMTRGSTFVDTTQVTTANPLICATTISTLRRSSWCPWSAAAWSLIANPTTNNATNSAMTTAVNIWTPTGCLSRPSSTNTFATTPRLESDSTPASASAAVGSKPRCRSSTTVVVTASDTASEISTDNTEATKRRPRTAATNPRTSSSSRPIRKKNRKIPMPRIMSLSEPTSTSPVTGPSTTPAVAYAMMEFSPNRLKMPSSNFARTISSPMDKRASCMFRPNTPEGRLG